MVQFVSSSFKGGPLRRTMELVMESARRRSPDESACAWLAVDDEASVSASDDLPLDRRRPRRSMDSVRCVWRVSSAWM